MNKHASVALMNTVGVTRHSLKPLEQLTTMLHVSASSVGPKVTAVHCAQLNPTQLNQELTEAVKQLDWLPEPGLPNDPYHNAKLESNIRRIKEGTRAIHLAAGFSHEMWPRSIEYFCIAKSFTTHLQVMPTNLHSNHELCQGFLWGGDCTPVSNTEKST